MPAAHFNKLVVGYDSSEPAQDALRFGSLLAEATGAELIVATVHPDRDRDHARERLPYGSGAELVALRGQSVAQALSEFAEADAADLIVLGASHRSELALTTVGGIADRLIQGAPCAVAVAPRGFRDETDPGLRVFGVAYDGSPESKRALHAAAALALQVKATLRIIGVLEPVAIPAAGMSAFYGYGDPAGFNRDALHAELEAAAASVPDELRPQTILATGSADEEIVRRAGVLDLLFAGSRGYGPLRRVLLGSVSAGLTHTVPCPVLILPRGAGAPSADQAEPVAATS